MAWNEEIKKELGHCGEQVFIGHNVIFTNPKEIFLADRVRIDPFVMITTGLVTKSNIQICAYAMLGGGNQHTITLGEWTYIGYGSKLFCASEDYSGEHGPVNEFWGSNEIRRGDIIFEDYSGVASDVIVFPGVVLPEGCTIGAKSLIHTKAPLMPWSVMIGTPPKVHKSREAATVVRLGSDSKFLKDHYEET